MDARTRDALIAGIRDLPDALALAIADLSYAELRATPLGGEWSVAQIVHHIADSHVNSYVRCKLIATETDPPLKPYDEGAWAQLPDARTADVSDTLRLLHGLHARWAHFWATLPDEAWARCGHHLADGPVTLARQLQLYVDHGAAHLEQIRRTVAALPGRGAVEAPL